MAKDSKNAGKYKYKIQIVQEVTTKDPYGCPITSNETVLTSYADVKTTRGYLLIKNNSDFEKAYTNFTIRFPKVEINRKMKVLFRHKTYTIEYMNNVNEANVELELQCKEVTH